MKQLFWVGVLLLGGAAALGGQEAADQRDFDHLQGKWTGLALDENGADVLPKEGLTIWFKGKEAVYRIPGQKDVVATFRIDAGKKPKQMDLTLAPDPNNKEDKGLQILAIYKLEGKVLRICYRLPLPKDKVQHLTVRPTAFDSKNDGTLITLKRAD